MKNKKKGSVLLSVLIFSTVLSVVVASVLKYSLSEYKSTRRSMIRDTAFHMAEAGIERAMYGLQYGEFLAVTGGAWTRTSINAWELVIESLEIGATTGDVTIFVNQIATDSYNITSIGRTDFSGGDVSRAIQVSVDVIEDPSQPNMHYRPDFVFRNGIKIGTHNGGPSHILSWNSEDSIDPIIENNVNANNGNTGFDCVFATLSDDPNSIVIDKIQIDGSMGVGGDIPPQFNTRKYKQAELRGPDTAPNISWDVDRIIPHFEIDIPSPEYPDPADYDTQVYIDQNEWQNSDTLVLGELNKTTYVTALYSCNMNNKTIIIQGDVVLFIDGAMNVNGNVIIEMNGDDSTLVIVPKESVNFSSSSELFIDSRYPKQLLLLGPMNGANIVIHSERFSGFIYAPDSKLLMHGTANPNGTRKNFFLGGIVADSMDNTYNGTGYGFVFASDESMRNQTSSTEPGVQTHVAVVQNWKEVPPSSLD